MQKRENPYTPGAGRKPPTLAGRDGDLENLQGLIERLAAGGYERSLIYSGLHGVGKTVLLIELDVLATEAGWATTDVQEVGSQPDFRVTFARMAARLLREMSRKHRIKDRIDRALGVVKAFSIAVPAGVQLKLDVEAATGVADSGDPEQDLTDLVREIGEVARITGAGALFLIDEMHNLDASSLAAICIAFQAISRNALPVAMVGAGLPDLQVRLMAAKPYADRLFQYHELGSLSPAAAARGPGRTGSHARGQLRRARRAASYASQPATRTSSRSTDSSCGTTPRPRRSPAPTSRPSARSSPTRSHETSSAPASSSPPTPSSAISQRWHRFSDPPYRSADVARAYGAKDQRGVSIHRDGLIEKGLIWAPRRGQVDFTVPLFAEYLRENHPLATFDDE